MEMDVSLHDALSIQVLSQDLVALSSGSVIQIYDLKSRVLFKTLYEAYNQGLVLHLPLSPNGSVLAIDKQYLVVIDPKTGKRDEHCMIDSGSRCDMFISKDAKSIAFITNDSKFMVMEMKFV